MQTSRGRGGFSDSTRGVMVVVVVVVVLLLMMMMEVGECAQQNYAAAANI